MNGEWPIVRLGDFCKKIGSGSTPKGGSEVYLEDGEISLIRSQNIYNDAFSPRGLAFITEDAADKLKNVTVEENDVLLNITGDSVARVCLAPREYLPARVNQHVLIIRPDESDFDARFVRYYLASPYMQAYLLGIAASGATRNALTKSQIENLQIPKPELDFQIYLADILEALDDKIALNRQINQTLESMAQALFKSWFVDFEPVRAKVAALETGEDPTQAAMRAISGKTDDELGTLQTTNPAAYEQLHITATHFPAAFIKSDLGLIPEGWEVKKAQEVSEVGIGKTPPRKESEWFSDSSQDIKWVSIRDMGNCGVYVLETSEYLTEAAVVKHNVRVVPSNTVILSFKLTVGRVAITSEAMVTNEAIAHFNVHQKAVISSEYLYSYLKQFDYSQLGSTSSIATAVNSKTIKDLKILLPAELIMESFSESVGHVFDQIKLIEEQNQTLANLRDTLLPELLSGELTVGEAMDEATNVPEAVF